MGKLADNYYLQVCGGYRDWPSDLLSKIHLSTAVHASSVSMLAPQRRIVFRSFLIYLGMLGALAPTITKSLSSFNRI
jgi:hypothetical protein